MNLRKLERDIVVSTRFAAVLAVLGSMAGSLLMFVLGIVEIYHAYAVWVPALRPSDVENVPASAASIISVIEGLDRFLIAIVMLYFAYGVYSLFIHPERPEEDLALPAWLKVQQIGQLKQVVAEVIIVILFVLFLRTVLRTFISPLDALGWAQLATLLVLPLSAMMLAVSLKLVELHPKPARRAGDEDKEAADAAGEPGKPLHPSDVRQQRRMSGSG